MEAGRAPFPGTAEHIAAVTGITVVELDLPAALALAHAPPAPPTLLPSLWSGVSGGTAPTAGSGAAAG